MRIAMLGHAGGPRPVRRLRDRASRRSAAGWPTAATGSSSTAAPRRRDEPPPAEHLGMELVHLPAARKRSLETLSHTALSVAPPAGPPHRRRVRLQRRQRAAAAGAARRPHPRRHARRRPGVEARQVGPGRPALLPRAEALAVRWSDALIADAAGHRRLLPPRVRRAHDAAHLRRAAHRPGRRPAGRARPRRPAATTSSSPGSSRRTTST